MKLKNIEEVHAINGRITQLSSRIRTISKMGGVPNVVIGYAFDELKMSGQKSSLDSILIRKVAVCAVFDTTIELIEECYDQLVDLGVDITPTDIILPVGYGEDGMTSLAVLKSTTASEAILGFDRPQM